MFQIGGIGNLGGSGSSGSSGTPPPVITPTAISLSATSITLPATNANSFVATITITATGGSYTGPVSIGGADAAKFALSHGGFYPCNLLVGSSNIAASGTYNITLTATPITTPFAIAVTIAITPTAISLSTTSISLPPANANALVATITVTATGGTYAGPVTLGGADAANFVLSNGGVYPCNLLVGSTSIGNATYNITLTATPITTPFAIAVSVITPTAISLSATSITFANFVNAGAFVATITVTATGGAYTGPVTLSGTNAALFALSNGGISPCNLLIGAANVPTGSYSISLTAAPVTQPFTLAITVTVPGFVPKADGVSADIYMDFVNGNYFGASPATWSFSRASPEWADNQVGVWSQFAANVPAITNKGLVVNPVGTNLALQCRDMTQAAWVKTNMTAALSQIGIDGVGSSATLLTATAANATVLQPITNPSSTTIGSFFLKRVTGTGVVNITVDGGTTWTAVTLTTSFTRPFRNQAALVNPSFGIQIVTSGDAVVADFAQCEVPVGALAVPSTPILTTSAQVTRAADFPLVNCSPGSAITLLGIGTPIGGQIGTPVIASITDGSNSNRLVIERAVTNARGVIVIGGTLTNMVIATAWTDVPGKIASSGTSGAFASCFNAGTVITAAPTGYPAGLNQINIGGGFSGANSYWYITSIAAWLSHQASNAALQALTTTGVTFPDGSTAASDGSTPFPTILNGYPKTAPPGIRDRNNPGQPPWMVAGVDYAVGPHAAYGTSIPFKVPGTDAMPSGSTFNGTNRITVNTNGTTFDGWDFTQGVGQGMLIFGNSCSFTNCKFIKTDDSFSFFDIHSTTGTTTVSYCDINGNAHNSDNTGLVSGSGLLFTYNYMRYAGSDFFNVGSNGSLVIKYNVIQDAGNQAGSHPDWMQVGTGTYTLTIDFNLVIQNNTVIGSQPFDFDTTCTLTGTNSQSFNTLLTLNVPSPGFPGTNNVNKLMNMAAANVTGTFVYNQNYIDPTGCVANAAGSRTTIWTGTFTGNVSVSGNITMDLNRVTTPGTP